MARSPCQPTNQALFSLPVAAEVTPYTRPRPAWAGVPWAPAFIMAVIDLRTAGSSCWGGGCGAGSASAAASGASGEVTSTGGRQVPDDTAAATRAMLSGLTWTFWPAMALALSASLPKDGSEPLNDLSGSRHG